MSIIEKAMKKFEEHGQDQFIKVRPDEQKAGRPTEGGEATRGSSIERAVDAAAKDLSESHQEFVTASPSPSPAPASAVSRRSADTSNLVFTIDGAHLKKSGLLSPTSTRTHQTEEYRSIKRPILMNAFGSNGALPVDHGNLVMITSAKAGEGKTYNAINLAISVTQELDKTVLLVDADVVNPSVCPTLGITEPEKGLIDVLADPALGVSDIMMRTNIPNLSILPAGTRHDRSTELLSGQGMHKLVKELSTRYSDRLVIFDTPPLLNTSEARVLANLMGQIILVVRATETSIATVKSVMPILESHDVVGTIFNGASGISQVLYSGNQK